VAEVRKFETGATRDIDTTKPDFEGFISPLVVARYGEYMHENRLQRDGSLRDSDNWQKGIPLKAYMKSAWRHFFAWWGCYRAGSKYGDSILEPAICGVLFNAMGYLHEHLKAKGYTPALEWDHPVLEAQRNEKVPTYSTRSIGGYTAQAVEMTKLQNEHEAMGGDPFTISAKTRELLESR
jgi:hypothetical protein